MDLFDINILVNAHREDAPEHDATRAWFERKISGPARFMMADIVLVGFVRIVTHPRIFKPPTPLDRALAAVDQIRLHPLCVLVRPGEQHFDLFLKLTRACNAKSDMISDAYLAAMAIENNARLYSCDRDFARFDGLDWSSPDL